MSADDEAAAARIAAKSGLESYPCNLRNSLTDERLAASSPIMQELYGAGGFPGGAGVFPGGAAPGGFPGAGIVAAHSEWTGN